MSLSTQVIGCILQLVSCLGRETTFHDLQDAAFYNGTVDVINVEQEGEKIEKHVFRLSLQIFEPKVEGWDRGRKLEHTFVIVFDVLSHLCDPIGPELWEVNVVLLVDLQTVRVGVD